MSSTPSIEIAGYDDLEEVTQLYIEGLREIESDLLHPIDPEECRKTVYSSYHEAPCFLLMDGGIQGMNGLCLGRSGHSRLPIFNEYMTYLRPGSRNIKNLKAVLDAARGFGQLVSIPYVTNHKTSRDLKTHLRLAKMLGFKVLSISGV